MRRVLGVLVAIVMTFYLAVIYNSESLIFLGYAELIVVSLLLLYNLVIFCRIHVFVETPIEITELHQEVPVRIVVRNYSCLPTGKIVVKLNFENTLYRKKKSATFCTNVANKKRRSGIGYSTSVILVHLEPKHIGKMKIRIRKARSYDLLGIIFLPIFRKRRSGQSQIMVIPRQCSVPIDIGRSSKIVATKRESSIQSGLREEALQDFQIRDYRPGDKIRSIHWKLSAKTDDLMVYERISGTGPIVHFYLDMADKRGTKRQRKRLSKRDAENIEAYFSIVLSISGSMIETACKHYVIWYDDTKKELFRYLIEKEEDVYAMLFALDGLWKNSASVDLEEEYQQKYHERQCTTKIVLNRELQLICNEEEIYQYQAKNIEDKLSTQEIFL